MLLTDSRQAERLVDAYFRHIKGEFHIEYIPAKTSKTDETIRQKIWDREPEPPTITGLALHLGFSSLDDFEEYKNSGGDLAEALKRGRLRIEVEYEKRLHQQSPTGAIFALKILGWAERDIKSSTTMPCTLKVEIIYTSIATAAEEREVIL
ncbi:hypothetical protein HQ865_01485 [Mucilaginibacter mali]|uniref:Uncharacterized protein n=1 Tax=Mucilaginibacter mali TaxID=2740462 RepID=A0A7D4Q690_9SPHI|nr:terminase small subunit [Mucilaginibacter mali]QKJ28485.1 hypothetical protein HQ865_01485 [Mucilaginibacter mali]